VPYSGLNVESNGGMKIGIQILCVALLAAGRLAAAVETNSPEASSTNAAMPQIPTNVPVRAGPLAERSQAATNTDAQAERAGRTIPVDGYAALVNDRVITVSDVLKAMQPLERQLRETYFDDTLTTRLESAYNGTLDTLIERELILNHFASQKQFSLPDSVVDSRIDEIVRNKFNNNRAELRKVLDQEGLTFDEWRTSYKNSLIVTLLRDREVDSKVVVSPLAVREAYEKAGDKYKVAEQLEVRAIVINRGATEEEIALKTKQAEDIRKRLLGGESFEELAKQVSEDQKASSGGYWGWIDLESRRAEIAAALKTLSVGEISAVVPVGDELYIFKVEGRKNASVVPFETVQDSIRAELQKKELKRLYMAWIERLKQNAYIKKF
jgi:peptidyl-prolyl cis-trans isomerase SurA